jgi:hypothetical protein
MPRPKGVPAARVRDAYRKLPERECVCAKRPDARATSLGFEGQIACAETMP